MGSNADGTARALEGTQDSEETREEAPGGSLCGSSNTTGSLSEVVVEDGVGCQVSPSSQQAPSDDSALQSEELLAHGRPHPSRRLCLGQSRPENLSKKIIPEMI